MAAFSGFRCQLCNLRYIVTAGYQCQDMTSIVCKQPNCQYCTTNGTCALCSFGFQVNSDDGSCESLTCDVVDCIECDSTGNSSLCT